MPVLVLSSSRTVTTAVALSLLLTLFTVYAHGLDTDVSSPLSPPQIPVCLPYLTVVSDDAWVI